MAQKGDLLSFRPDIKVLDATIRDGGLVNDFYFTDEFIKALYKTNVKAGVDYMEFGYRAPSWQTSEGVITRRTSIREMRVRLIWCVSLHM